MKLSKFFGLFTVIAIFLLLITIFKDKKKKRDVKAPNVQHIGEKINNFLGVKKMKQDKSLEEEDIMESKDQKHRVFDPRVQPEDENITCAHNDLEISLKDLKQKYIDYQDKCVMERCDVEEQRVKKIMMFDIEKCEKVLK